MLPGGKRTGTTGLGALPAPPSFFFLFRDMALSPSDTPSTTTTGPGQTFRPRAGEPRKLFYRDPPVWCGEGSGNKQGASGRQGRQGGGARGPSPTGQVRRMAWAGTPGGYGREGRLKNRVFPA